MKGTDKKRFTGLVLAILDHYGFRFNGLTVRYKNKTTLTSEAIDWMKKVLQAWWTRLQYCDIDEVERCLEYWYMRKKYLPSPWDIRGAMEYIWRENEQEWKAGRETPRPQGFLFNQWLDNENPCGLRKADVFGDRRREEGAPKEKGEQMELCAKGVPGTKSVSEVAKFKGGAVWMDTCAKRGTKKRD